MKNEIKNKAGFDITVTKLWVLYLGSIFCAITNAVILWKIL